MPNPAPEMPRERLRRLPCSIRRVTWHSFVFVHYIGKKSCILEPILYSDIVR